MEEILKEVERRRSIVENYYRNYNDYLQRENYAKASEMLWGIINNIASILSILNGGKPISKHDELRRFINNIASMLRDSDIVEWYSACEALHANYFHDFMDKEMFEHYRLHAEKLINILQQLVAEKLRELGIRK